MVKEILRKKDISKGREAKIHSTLYFDLKKSLLFSIENSLERKKPSCKPPELVLSKTNIRLFLLV